MESKGNDFSILVLRLASGGFMLTAHGWGKLMTWATLSQNFPDPLGVGPAVSLALAIFAEVVCAAMVALGLFSRLAAIPLVVTMVVAVFIVHAGDPWSKKELGALYLACYIVILLAGSGKYSLQSILKISSSSRFPFVSWLMR